MEQKRLNVTVYKNDTKTINFNDVTKQNITYIYIYIYIYTYIHSKHIHIPKIRHLFLNQLYFRFFQTFKDSKSLKVREKMNYNSFRNKCLIVDIYIEIFLDDPFLYIYIYINKV